MDIKDTHFARVDDFHHTLRFDAIQVLLILSELNKLVGHDVPPHVILCHKVEVMTVLSRFGWTSCIYRQYIYMY